MLKGLSTLDHVDNEHSLEVSVILDDVFLERFISATNPKKETVTSDLTLDPMMTNQVEVALDPNNWDGDPHLMNVIDNQLINWLTRSWLELDG